jgi:hypothetical protein
MVRRLSALLRAQGASDRDGLEGEFLHPGGDVPPTTLALDDEQLAFQNAESHGRTSIGEKDRRPT